jgi:hypothetical protein
LRRRSALRNRGRVTSATTPRRISEPTARRDCA